MSNPSETQISPVVATQRHKEPSLIKLNYPALIGSLGFLWSIRNHINPALSIIFPVAAFVSSLDRQQRLPQLALEYLNGGSQRIQEIGMDEDEEDVEASTTGCDESNTDDQHSDTIFEDPQNETLDDSDADEDARSTWQSLEQELLTSEIPNKQMIVSELNHRPTHIMFPLNMLSGRPHIHVHFAEGMPEINTLLDSGSKFNILSINLLHQIERCKGTKFQLRQPRIKLTSHTDDPLEICGEAAVPIRLTDSTGQGRWFNLVFFQVTNDNDKFLLGTEFFAARDCNVSYKSSVRRKQGELTIPRKIVEQEADFEEKICDFHFSSTTTFLMRSLKQVTLFPGRLHQIRCGTKAQNKKVEKKIKRKDIIGQITHDSLNTKTSFLARVSALGEILVEIFNEGDMPITLEANSIIAAGRVLDKDEIKDIRSADQTIGAICKLEALETTKMNECFCNNSIDENITHIFIIFNDGLTHLPNVDLLALYDKLPTFDEMFWDGGRLYVKYMTKPSVETCQAMIKHLHADQRIVLTIPNQGLTLSEIDWAHDVVLAFEKAGKTCELRSYNTTSCERHKLWRVPMQDESIFRFSYLTKKPNAKELVLEDTKNLSSFEFDGGLTQIYLDDTLELSYQVPVYHLHIPSAVGFNTDKLTRIIRRFMCEPFRANIDLKLVGLQIPEKFKTHKLLAVAQQELAKHKQAKLISLTSEGYQTIQKDPSIFNIQTINEQHQSDIKFIEDRLELLDTEYKIATICEENTIQALEEKDSKPKAPTKEKNQPPTSYLANGTEITPDEMMKIIQQEEDTLQTTIQITPETSGEENDNVSEVTNFRVKVEPTSEILPLKTLDPEKQKKWREFFGGFKDDVPNEDREFYSNLLDQNTFLLATTSEDYRVLNVPDKMDIFFEGQPILQRGYPINATMEIFARRLLATAVKQKHIELVKYSRFASPCFCVIKPGARAKSIYQELQDRLAKGASEKDLEDLDPGSCLRLVIDFRQLNAGTKGIQCPFPTIAENLAFAQGKKVFSAYDLKHYFRSLTLSEDASWKACFVVGQAIYRPLRVMEGLKSCPFFAHSISISILERSREFCMPFIDDFFLATIDRFIHRKATIAFYADMNKCEALISVPKMEIATNCVKLLGHIIKANDQGIVTYSPMTQAFKIFNEYELPTTTQALYKYIGLANWCQGFVSNFQIVMSPLNQLLAARVKSRTKEVIQWDNLPIEKRAFQLINAKLANLQPLTILSDRHPIRITCDASHFALGATIETHIDGEWRVTNFYSKRFDPSVVRATSAINKELLACLLTLDRFKMFVLAAPCVYLLTDCKALVFLYANNINATDSKCQRWLSRLSEYPLTYVHHINRELNQPADTLSNRFPPKEQATHMHFAKYGFSKARRSQINIEFKEGDAYTQDEFEKLVLENPNCITAPGSDPNEDMVTDEIPPCLACEEDGYNVEIEKVDQITVEEDPLKHMEEFPWLAIVPAIQEIFETKFVTTSLETGLVSEVNVSDKFVKPFSHITADEILKSQQEDPFCSKTVQILQDTPTNETPSHLKRYRLINGTLLARMKNKRFPDSRENLALVLPRPLITEVIGLTHIIAHAGSKKLRQMIRRYFFNNEIDTICRAISLGCIKCGLFKNLGQRDLPPGMLKPATEPCQIIYLDIMYMKPARHLNHKFKVILNFVCDFSGYVWSFPLTNQETGAILPCFEQLVPHLPSIQEFVSDNATNLLTNVKIKNFLNQFGINSRLVLPYHSQSNAKVEVMNRMIRTALVLTTECLGGNWVSNLPIVVTMMNTIPHTIPRLSNFTPFELVHRRPPVNTDPLQFLTGLKPTHYERALKTYEKAVHKFKQETYQAITKQVEQAMETTKLKVNSFVHLLDQDKGAKKGIPFVVRDRVYQIVYRKGFMLVIQNVRDPTERVRCHISKVRILQERDPKYFNDLSKGLQKMIGRPLTQRQLRRLHRRQLWHKDLDDNQPSDTDSSDDEPSTKPDSQPAMPHPSPDNHDTISNSSPATPQSPDTTRSQPKTTNERRSTAIQKVKDWLTPSAKDRSKHARTVLSQQPPTETGTKPKQHKTRSILSKSMPETRPAPTRQDLSRELTPSISSKYKKFSDSAVQRMRKAWRKTTTPSTTQKSKQPSMDKPTVQSKKKRQKSPTPQTSPQQSEAEEQTPPLPRRRAKQKIDYKQFHKTGKKH